MVWLTGNWIWVFAVIAGLWFFMRRGGLHTRSMGDRHGRSQDNTGEGHGGAAQPAQREGAVEREHGMRIRGSKFSDDALV